MSKLDWAVAESTYITKSEASYDWLAQMFGVAKSTIVRRAVKLEWSQKREQYIRKRIRVLEERTLESRIQVEERQLRALRNVQTIFSREVIRIGKKQENREDVTRKEWYGLARITKEALAAIMMERTILGLPSKLIRIKNEEVIKDIQEMMGYKDEPLWQKYTLSKQLLESTDLDAIKKHLELLKQYTDKVEKTGDYTVKHNLWDK